MNGILDGGGLLAFRALPKKSVAGSFGKAGLVHRRDCVPGRFRSASGAYLGGLGSFGIQGL